MGEVPPKGAEGDGHRRDLMITFIISTPTEASPSGPPGHLPRMTATVWTQIMRLPRMMLRRGRIWRRVSIALRTGWGISGISGIPAGRFLPTASGCWHCEHSGGAGTTPPRPPGAGCRRLRTIDKADHGANPSAGLRGDHTLVLK